MCIGINILCAQLSSLIARDRKAAFKWDVVGNGVGEWVDEYVLHWFVHPKMNRAHLGRKERSSNTGEGASDFPRLDKRDASWASIYHDNKGVRVQVATQPRNSF